MWHATGRSKLVTLQIPLYNFLLTWMYGAHPGRVCTARIVLIIVILHHTEIRNTRWGELEIYSTPSPTRPYRWGYRLQNQIFLVQAASSWRFMNFHNPKKWSPKSRDSDSLGGVHKLWFFFNWIFFFFFKLDFFFQLRCAACFHTHTLARKNYRADFQEISHGCLLDDDKRHSQGVF